MFVGQLDGRWLPFPALHYLSHDTRQHQRQQSLNPDQCSQFNPAQQCAVRDGRHAAIWLLPFDSYSTGVEVPQPLIKCSNSGQSVSKGMLKERVFGQQQQELASNYAMPSDESSLHDQARQYI